jgi:DNA-binding transcriptional regulator YdaS (Cro superfamily)
MEEVSLGVLVIRIGQARVARALGVKPASISKAVKVGRNITVTLHGDGTFTAKELRPFPAPKNLE